MDLINAISAYDMSICPMYEQSEDTLRASAYPDITG